MVFLKRRGPKKILTEEGLGGWTLLIGFKKEIEELRDIFNGFKESIPKVILNLGELRQKKLSIFRNLELAQSQEGIDKLLDELYQVTKLEQRYIQFIRYKFDDVCKKIADYTRRYQVNYSRYISSLEYTKNNPFLSDMPEERRREHIAKDQETMDWLGEQLKEYGELLQILLYLTKEIIHPVILQVEIRLVDELDNLQNAKGKEAVSRMRYYIESMNQQLLAVKSLERQVDPNILKAKVDQIASREVKIENVKIVVTGIIQILREIAESLVPNILTGIKDTISIISNLELSTKETVILDRMTFLAQRE